MLLKLNCKLLKAYNYYLDNRGLYFFGIYVHCKYKKSEIIKTLFQKMKLKQKANNQELKFPKN